VLATIFALFGWLSGPSFGSRDTHRGWLDVVTVVRIYCYSIGVTVVLALVYYILNNVPFLDNLGRSHRGKKNKVIEDFITELQRLTIVHEEGGQSRCRLSWR
jgi:H+-transporting ATPase